MAFAAVGALIAGEAVTTALVLSAVAEIGTAIGVVGAVTGNKEMMKIGGTMALVGGVGSMAMGASGAAGAGAAAEGSLATEGTGALLKGVDAAAGDAFSGASLGGDAAMSNFASGAAGASNLTNPTMNGQMPDLDNPFSESANITSPGNPNPSAMKVGPTPESTVNDVAGASGPTGVTGPTSPADANYDAWDFQGPHKITDGPIAPQDSGSFFKSVSEFANKNPALFNSGMQLVGGAMKGANDREMFDQQMGLRQQQINQTSYGSQVASAPRGILAGAR